MGLLFVQPQRRHKKNKDLIYPHYFFLKKMEEFKGADLAVFLKAIEVGDLEKVKQLMPSCRHYFFSYIRQCPLSFEILRYFLQQGINPNDIHSDYQRPIYYAILMGHYKCIPLLIDAKANINDIIENV